MTCFQPSHKPPLETRNLNYVNHTFDVITKVCKALTIHTWKWAPCSNCLDRILPSPVLISIICAPVVGGSRTLGSTLSDLKWRHDIKATELHSAKQQNKQKPLLQEFTSIIIWKTLFSLKLGVLC